VGKLDAADEAAGGGEQTDGQTHVPFAPPPPRCGGGGDDDDDSDGRTDTRERKWPIASRRLLEMERRVADELAAGTKTKTTLIRVERAPTIPSACAPLRPQLHKLRVRTGGKQSARAHQKTRWGRRAARAILLRRPAAALRRAVPWATVLSFRARPQAGRPLYGGMRFAESRSGRKCVLEH
jgi:hypothetical protein